MSEIRTRHHFDRTALDALDSGPGTSMPASRIRGIIAREHAAVLRAGGEIYRPPKRRRDEDADEEP